MRLFYLSILAILSFFSHTLAQTNVKPRVIILTDIEADPDDTQSMIRLLLYANQLDIKGLIATTSCWMKEEVNPKSLVKIINTYGQVQANLLKHEPGYPSEATLLNLIKSGPPKYGMLGVGKGQDTEGSDWIIEELRKKDDRPLWISVWGGVNTLAQSLYKIRESFNEQEALRLISKLRVYTISDQDDSGIWIRNEFPELFYIVTPGDKYGQSTWNGIMTVAENLDNSEISTQWLAENIQQGHGPLGALYPDVSWGIEGDTPAFLYLIPNGLNATERPHWGGWGGRYESYIPKHDPNWKGNSGVPNEPETRKIWTNASDTYTPYIPKTYGRSVKRDTTSFVGPKVSLWRWRDDFQNDFAARMDWCTQSYDEANHPPVPVLKSSTQLTVKTGQQVMLDAFDSWDPDGDNLSYLWFVYPEAGSFRGEFKLRQPENAQRLHFTAPKVKKEETIHIILRLTDKGSPALSRYQRVIVTIRP